MADVDITQEALGEKVATLEGRAEPHTQPTVATWLRRDYLLSDPQRVIAIEQALGVEPGTFTRLIGYLPTSAVPALSVPDALARDVDLTRDQREDLLALYQQMTERTKARRRARAADEQQR